MYTNRPETCILFIFTKQAEKYTYTAAAMVLYKNWVLQTIIFTEYTFYYIFAILTEGTISISIVICSLTECIYACHSGGVNRGTV